MKNALFIIILIGLSLCFTNADSQSVNNSKIPTVSVVGPPPEAPSCLDSYLSFCDNLQNILSAATANCTATFANDPDGHIECNNYAFDLYFNMHGVADAMYDRCKLNEAQ
ncbi:hypothetical protein EZ428_02780 [Pedobacter frigiditerrae]|uniref:Uncharacterized protein n=1 Tax=Pedobacter frigiditerrae TaxID=2530452 RepID=A0A4R0N301_9SPHI|nr:hypothetical protein [Pedobacter frigiditerrae]TCC93713.1 hypothetical protein EZ428_02780 [Pedobacter frigiditerrae]